MLQSMGSMGLASTGADIITSSSHHVRTDLSTHGCQPGCIHGIDTGDAWGFGSGWAGGSRPAGPLMSSWTQMPLDPDA